MQVGDSSIYVPRKVKSVRQSLLALYLALSLVPSAAMAQSSEGGQAGRRHVAAQAGATRRGPAQLSEQDRIVHVLNRLTFGPCPGDINRVKSMGLDNFIEEQLHPEKMREAQSVMVKLEQP